MEKIVNTSTTMRVTEEKWDKIFKRSRWLVRWKDGTETEEYNLEAIPLEKYKSAWRLPGKPISLDYDKR